MPLQRPAQLAWPYLNPNSPLYQGLVFAGLGPHAGGWDYHDCSPYRNNGRLTNMDPATDWVWVPELGRWGLDFDGDNDQVTGPAFTVQECTLSMWCYPTGGNRMLAGICDSIAAGGIEWGIHTTLNPQFAYYDGAVRGWYRSPSTLTASVWSHIAIVWQPSTPAGSFYINGVFANSVATTSGTVVYVGDLFDVGHASVNNRWLGRLTDVVLHARALSASEISALADPSNAMLSVGNTSLILPPRRSLFAAAVAGVTARRFPWQIRRSRRMAGVR